MSEQKVTTVEVPHGAIVLRQGQYVFIDQNGEHRTISLEEAKEMEQRTSAFKWVVNEAHYNMLMQIHRGGSSPEEAREMYPIRYKYQVDRLSEETSGQDADEGN